MASFVDKKIIVIDDETGILETISEILSSYGFQVETAMNGKVALSKLMNGNYDLIISDIAMPQESGMDLVITFRKSGIETPVVLMSGHYDLSQKVMFSLGIADFIKKPFRPAELIEKITKIPSIAD